MATTATRKTLNPTPIPVAPEKPANQFDLLRHEMRQMVEGFFLRPLARLAANEPPLNLYKQDNALILEAAIPGMEKKDLQVEVSRTVVKILGEIHLEKTHQDEAYYHSEIRSGSIQRSVQLPMEVDPSKVTATMEGGILKLTMQLADPSLYRSIKIEVKS